MHSQTRLLAVLLVTLVGIVLGSPESASAGTSLYTGSIRLRLSSQVASYSYGVPFGSNISYPKLDNLPTGNAAFVSGSAPATFAIHPNQMVLQTSLSTSSPPPSWTGLTFAASSFSGGHAAGSFHASGAPGAATSAPLSALPVSKFGVTFSGTPIRFGGTMQLLGSSWIWFNAGYRSPNGHVWCTGCAVYNRPLAAIGGSFGGSAVATTYVNQGTGSVPTFFSATVWGFPWTTGTVSAKAPAITWPGHNPTTETLTAKGTDKRTPQGSGEIQLVTPFVVRLQHYQNITYRSGIAIASLHFVPEPAAALQLAGGLSALAALYNFSHRTKRDGRDPD